jgi:hypothetical protein
MGILSTAWRAAKTGWGAMAGLAIEGVTKGDNHSFGDFLEAGFQGWMTGLFSEKAGFKTGLAIGGVDGLVGGKDGVTLKSAAAGEAAGIAETMVFG